MGASGSSQTRAISFVSSGSPSHIRGGDTSRPSPVYFLGDSTARLEGGARYFDSHGEKIPQGLLHTYMGDIEKGEKDTILVTTDKLALPEGNVESHHDSEANHERHSGKVGVTTFLGFGNEFLDDDKDHGASSEGQGVGQ